MFSDGAHRTILIPTYRTIGVAPVERELIFWARYGQESLR